MLTKIDTHKIKKEMIQSEKEMMEDGILKKKKVKKAPHLNRSSSNPLNPTLYLV
jgi:hypothetical protein